MPRRETYLLFARPPAPCDLTHPADAAIALITSPDDPAIQPLDHFCTSNGFPPGWPAGMLGSRAQALTAAHPDTDAIMAMAWLTTAPFYVEEIDHTLDPAGGAYFFGDFVAPAHRGRGLQRALLRHRLALSPGATAYTIIRNDNIPSIANYQSVGFTPTTRLSSRRWLGATRWTCSTIPGVDARLPTFERPSGNRLVARAYAASSST
jgi:ribosomal protein S18 acetylase RimI-like enzyme